MRLELVVPLKWVKKNVMLTGAVPSAVHVKLMEKSRKEGGGREGGGEGGGGREGERKEAMNVLW